MLEAAPFIDQRGDATFPAHPGAQEIVREHAAEVGDVFLAERIERRAVASGEAAQVCAEHFLHGRAPTVTRESDAGADSMRDGTGKELREDVAGLEKPDAVERGTHQAESINDR